ncbi:MAG: nucleotide exchange factor GrpE [Bacteroidales bacterium]|nr:nucleotide exchange factor GrpE [Candidatus Cacconaster merdequi]
MAETDKKVEEQQAQQQRNEESPQNDEQQSGRPESEEQVKEEEKCGRDRKSKKNRIQELETQLAEEKDKYLRLAAEFDNYRRRTAKERLDLIGSASKEVLLGILPVVDDCERALQVLKESDASEAAVEGTELICNKLLNFLKSRGMTKIEARGEEFNTDLHEAVAQFPVQDESQKNKVIDVTQEGYMLNGTVARFAKVVVGI